MSPGLARGRGRLGLAQTIVRNDNYQAIATKTGKSWSVAVPGLPGERTAHAEGRTWREAQHQAFAAVRRLLGDDAPEVFGLGMTPSDPEAAAAVDAQAARPARAVVADIARNEPVEIVHRLLMADPGKRLRPVA